MTDIPVLYIPYDDHVERRLRKKDVLADIYRSASDYEGPVGVDMQAPPED